jgi:hypothetical protein
MCFDVITIETEQYAVKQDTVYWFLWYTMAEIYASHKDSYDWGRSYNCKVLMPFLTDVVKQ